MSASWTPDAIWKVVSTIVSLLVVPLFIWIWNTNTKLEHMVSEFKHTTEDVKKLEVAVEVMEKEQNELKTDVKLIQQKLDRVEKMTEELLELTKEKK